MMKKNLKTTATLITIISVFGIFIMSCDPAKRWEEAESDNIQSFLSTRGDTVFEQKPSGLYYYNIVEGSGISPDDLDTVFIRYRLFFLDYTLFDTNLEMSGPFGFLLGTGTVVNGVDEGVRYMKAGGKAKFVTPSSLAYGPNGRFPYIKGYTPLLWEIELVEVNPASKK